MISVLHQWGAIIRKVAVLVPDESCLILFRKNVCQKSKQAAFNLGPMLPPSDEGSPLSKFDLVSTAKVVNRGREVVTTTSIVGCYYS